MHYQATIENVVDYIGAHLDTELSLDDLASVAGLSKYHFHRLFTAHTGMSVQQMIRWLRLKRAAHQLVVHPDMAIIQIAFEAGFESHEAFTRVFKKSCGLAPAEFRKSCDWSYWERAPYRLPNRGIETMNVTIKDIKARRLAVYEHRGDPAKVGESVSRLIEWAKAHRMNLKPAPGEAFGYAYDDPKTTPPEEFRFDLAITVPENATVDGVVVEKRLPAGRYAVAVHKGTRDNIGETVYAMYRDWLPSSGETLGDLPCIFSYYNFDHEVAETELLTECWLLLK